MGWIIGKIELDSRRRKTGRRRKKMKIVCAFVCAFVCVLEREREREI